MDKKVVRRMIKRLDTVPESYEQSAWFIEEDEGSPCGTVACLAGEAVICSANTVKQGIKLALENFDMIVPLAEKVLGLHGNHGLFDCAGSGWPRRYRKALQDANSRKEKANVAAAYLRESLERGTLIWQDAND